MAEIANGMPKWETKPADINEYLITELVLASLILYRESGLGKLSLTPASRVRHGGTYKASDNFPAQKTSV